MTNTIQNMAELRKIRHYRITSISEEAPKIKIITFEPVGSADAIQQFLPGQFVNLHVTDKDGKQIFRPYSVACAPGQKDIELCIKIYDDGKLSSVLDKNIVGDAVGVSGPFGHFKYEGQSSAVFVAAGTGIAPVMAMIRHICHKKLPGKFVVFYTNKTQESIIYFRELKEIEREHGIKVVMTLTQETPHKWDGELGRINKEMLGKYINNAAGSHFFMCGPLEFIKAVRESVVSFGAKPENIKAEGWG